MNKSEKINRSIDYGDSMNPFMLDVMKTVVKQPDYTGFGSHDLDDHGGHGLHSQVSIGLKNATLNFRAFPDFKDSNNNSSY